MQRMISHARPLPAAACGHAARHIVDQRALRCGGGHQLECSCRSTARYAHIGLALLDWTGELHRGWDNLPARRPARSRPSRRLAMPGTPDLWSAL